jgi:uroporphyrinogen-III synthase
MADGRVDAIALTSSAQVRRLVEIARVHRCEDKLRAGLHRTRITSVVVSEELKAYGLQTDITPANDAFFIRPLISAMAASLNAPGG